jgi:hypothetical protein
MKSIASETGDLWIEPISGVSQGHFPPETRYHCRAEEARRPANPVNVQFRTNRVVTPITDHRFPVTIGCSAGLRQACQVLVVEEIG